MKSVFRSPRAMALALGFAFVLAPRCPRAEGRAPIVAVFTIQDTTGKLSQVSLSQLTDYLTAQIAAGGVLQVVPGTQLKERLRQKKIVSYKSCYDEKCQIEIGRELAAQKSLATKITGIGARCAILSTMFDLKRATSEVASSHKGECDHEALVASLEQIATSIKAQIVRSRSPAEGGLIISSRPSGAEALLNGLRLKGKTPLTVSKLKEGKHALLLTKGEFRTLTSVTVVPGRVSTINVELQLTAAARRRRAVNRQQAENERIQRLLTTKVARRRKTILGYVALVTAVAAAAGAGILYGVGFSGRAEADETYMGSTTQAEMDKNWADVESSDKLIIGGHVLIGVAGIAAAVALYELMTRPEMPDVSSSVKTASGALGGLSQEVVWRF